MGEPVHHRTSKLKTGDYGHTKLTILESDMVKIRRAATNKGDAMNKFIVDVVMQHVNKLEKQGRLWQTKTV